MRAQHGLWKQGAFGSKGENYLLFDGLTKTTSLKRLRKAYEQLGGRVKTWHSCRHTRGTILFGETGDRELAKMWLGHGSNKVFERYNHTYEQIVRDGARPKLSRMETFESWFVGPNMS